MDRKISKKRAVISVILFGLILCIFSGIFMNMSYRNLQTNTYVHIEKLHTISAVRKLNIALHFGRPLDRYYELDALVEETMALSDRILGIEIVDQKGSSVLTCGQVPEAVRQSGVREEYILKIDSIYVFVPFDAGGMIVRLESESANRNREALIRGWEIGGGLALLILLLTIVAFSIRGKDGIGYKRMRITSILILIAAQAALGGAFIYSMDRDWRTSMEQISISTADMVERNINAAIEKGVPYREQTGIDSYLEDIAADIPELSDISIGEHVTGTADNTSSFPLSIEGLEENEVRLTCCYDQDLIRSNRLNNFIDSVILLLITMLIGLETGNFLTEHFVMKGLRKEGELYLPGLRLFIFVVSLACTLDVGFFSVLSRKMFIDMELPDSMSFLSGMPNTMYSAAVLIGLFTCSSLIRRIGMRKLLATGLLFGILGYAFCAAAPNLPSLIAARFIYGFCDGIIINSIRLYASSQRKEEFHRKILVQYMGASSLGVSCGVVIGGLVADSISYKAVFCTGAVLGAVCIFLLRFAGFPEKQDREQGEQISFSGAVRELKKPRVLLFMLFAVLPVYIATLFVGYTFPLFGDEAGFSNSMVSACLMVNFIIIAYLTDFIADRALRLLQPKYLMAAYMALQAVSIGLFVVTGRVWAAVLALVLTSLWDCFGMVAMDMGLSDVEGTSTEQCTLLQMIFGKLGMALGPVVITSRLARGAAGATGVIVLLLITGLLVYGMSLFVFRGKTGDRQQEKAV